MIPVSRRSVLATAGLALTAGCSVLDSSPSVTLPDTDWTSSGTDQYNTGAVPAEDGLSGLDQVGSIDVGTGPFSAPIVLDDVVYVGNRESFLAISVTDAAEIDSFDHEVSAMPTVVDGDLLLPTYDRFTSPLQGTLVRLSTGGELEWDLDLPGGVALSPTVGPDGIAIRTVESSCFVSTEGELLWAEDASRYAGGFHSYSDSSPVIADNRVFVPGPTEVRCHDLETGEELWAVPVREMPRLAYADGTLYVSALFDGIVAFDGESGDQLWEHDVVAWQGGAHSPAIGDELIYTTSGFDVVALDKSNGDEVWRYDGNSDTDGLGSPSASDLVLVGDALVVGSTGPTLTVLSAADGTERFQYSGAGTVYSPAVASGSIVVLEAEGGLNRPGTLRVFQPG